MRGQQSAVEVALRDPVYVYQDGRHLGRRIFYRPFTLPKPYDRYYLRVVIRYFAAHGKERGEIITAFSSANIRQGDIRIWSKYETTNPSFPLT